MLFLHVAHSFCSCKKLFPLIVSEGVSQPLNRRPPFPKPTLTLPWLLFSKIKQTFPIFLYWPFEWQQLGQFFVCLFCFVCIQPAAVLPRYLVPRVEQLAMTTAWDGCQGTHCFLVNWFLSGAFDWHIPQQLLKPFVWGTLPISPLLSGFSGIEACIWKS